MKLFKYLSSKSIKETYDIYKAVAELKSHAISKYRNNWEDALDAAFFHIIENYDSSKGELKHYATKVVGTIFLSNNKKEVANDEQTMIGLDTMTAKEYINSPEEYFEEDIKSSNIDECVHEMVHLFVRDFKFFTSSDSKHRKMNYSDLFKKYSLDSISKAREYLLENYQDDVGRFVTLSKSTNIRSFDENRYLKSIDNSIEYVDSLNGIVIIKRKQGSHIKKIYKVDLELLIDRVLDLFYSSNDCGKIMIEDIPIYLSLAGKIMNSVEDLKNSLESELVGSLLSRTSLKVLSYERGKEVLFSSTKDTQCDVILPLFGKNMPINFERIVIKEV